MTDLEARLEQALKADDPAPRDPMFRVEILMRRERAAFRRRLLAAAVTALGVAILAPLGLGAIGELVGAGPMRLAAVAAAGVVLTVFLAAPYVGALPALRSLAGRPPASDPANPRPTPGPGFWH